MKVLRHMEWMELWKNVVRRLQRYNFDAAEAFELLLIMMM